MNKSLSILDYSTNLLTEPKATSFFEERKKEENVKNVESNGISITSIVLGVILVLVFCVLIVFLYISGSIRHESVPALFSFLFSKKEDKANSKTSGELKDGKGE